METRDPVPPIRSEDIDARSIQRRTFLGRFGAMAALSGMLGYAAGCEPTDSCDNDQGDSPTPSSDSDNSDDPMADQDFADLCDSDGV